MEQKRFWTDTFCAPRRPVHHEDRSEWTFVNDPLTNMCAIGKRRREEGERRQKVCLTADDHGCIVNPLRPIVHCHANASSSCTRTEPRSAWDSKDDSGLQHAICMQVSSFLLRSSFLLLLPECWHYFSFQLLLSPSLSASFHSLAPNCAKL